MTNLPFDLHEDLISVAEAAALAGVTEAAVRQWKRRGHLHPAGADEDGRPLFTGIAVLRAEAKTRKGARRRPVAVS
jgi:DNA-binding transcriptional MerR regulator